MKYNELEKVHKKLESVKKEKAKKKEPVSPNCEMLLSMISSNLKLAGDKLNELESHCKDLEKVHQTLKSQEESSKKVAKDLRAKIRQLTKARKDAANALSSAKRKKSHVKRLLADITKMEVKVSQMCKAPSAYLMLEVQEQWQMLKKQQIKVMLKILPHLKMNRHFQHL